ncbi:MAG: ACT domain-containing protein [Paludibacteraceae bacterium]|nr:ACT domain-containing protein [Paludibacteraceae bacterium]MBQ1751805.1 ACT domain-containing protein [Paludibacteraceae bacterium]MBQ1851275.1 ACT domain-containing protein [Paludibacteraceae bacterium]MBQ2064651.1 ACT domain-containing protein [Paludibacteraceae bacterium]MBQ4033057.1 ACT domain-containing protein [Paludibacteraceae bacterium]
MTTIQLSIFLENKTGRLNDVTKVLSKAGVNMRAFSVADNSDFGILRLLVDDTDKAKQVLKENGFAVSTTDVIALNISNTAGTLDKILDLLAQAKVYIEYMYAFSDGERASVAIKPDDMNAALDTLAKNGIEMI